MLLPLRSWLRVSGAGDDRWGPAGSGAFPTPNLSEPRLFRWVCPHTDRAAMADARPFLRRGGAGEYRLLDGALRRERVQLRWRYLSGLLWYMFLSFFTATPTTDHACGASEVVEPRLSHAASAAPRRPFLQYIRGGENSAVRVQTTSGQCPAYVAMIATVSEAGAGNPQRLPGLSLSRFAGR